MLKTLFSSNTRVKILSLFFTNPEKEFYLREIEKLIKENITSVRREISSLKGIELLKEHLRGNNKYYQLNKNFCLYPELKSIIFKTSGIQGIFKDTFKKIPGVKTAFIYGSYAKGNETGQSDVDLMVIGAVDYNRLLKSIKKIEEKIKREIDFVVYNEKEFLKKVKDEYFMKNIMGSPKINIIGDVNEYSK